MRVLLLGLLVAQTFTTGSSLKLSDFVSEIRATLSPDRKTLIIYRAAPDEFRVCLAPEGDGPVECWTVAALRARAREGR